MCCVFSWFKMAHELSRKGKALWICRYCNAKVEYEDMESHINQHNSLKLKSFSPDYLSKYHFTKEPGTKIPPPRLQGRAADYTWNCKHCDESVAYHNLKSHTLTHKGLDVSNCRDHFTVGRKRELNETKCKRRPTDYTWLCKHCDKAIVYKGIKNHIVCVHKDEVDPANFGVNYLSKNHFTRGELNDKEPRVSDYKWDCKYCNKSVGYKNKKSHIATTHKDLAVDSSDHFTRGRLYFQDQKKGRLADYKWICNYCDKSVGYEQMKRHVLSAVHQDLEPLELNANYLSNNYFTRGELRQDGHDDPPKARVRDFKWICNYCQTSVGYENRKRHLATVHRDREIAPDVEHFRRGNFIVRDQDPSSYIWQCNYCSSQMRYHSIVCHITSAKHAEIQIERTGLGYLSQTHFTRGERRPYCVSDNNVSSTESESEDRDPGRMEEKRKMRILQVVARYESQLN